jgi:hypothetical protein
LSDLHCLKNKVAGIISHPPCDHFAVSGARWFKAKGEKPLLDGLSMVDAVLRIVYVTKPRWWFIENPVGRLVHYLGKPKFIFNPCDFAGYLENPIDEAYTKKTCLWGEFRVPEMKRIEPIEHGDGSRIHEPVVNGKKIGWNTLEAKNIRSKTPIGFAKAFTEVNL